VILKSLKKKRELIAN